MLLSMQMHGLLLRVGAFHVGDEKDTYLKPMQGERAEPDRPWNNWMLKGLAHPVNPGIGACNLPITGTASCRHAVPNMLNYTPRPGPQQSASLLRH